MLIYQNWDPVALILEQFLNGAQVISGSTVSGNDTYIHIFPGAKGSRLGLMNLENVNLWKYHSFLKISGKDKYLIRHRSISGISSMLAVD